jgi:FemAB-related protein (PEP-CTERM system-associated)
MRTASLNGDTRAWDELVMRDAASSFCHLSGWRDILSDVLGAQSLYRVATNDDGAWEGLLPLVSVKSRIFGHYLVSVPFLNYGGPVGSLAARRQLVADAVNEARRARADLLELRTRDVGDAELELSVASRKVTVVLPLPSSPDELFKSFPSKLRSQIRRPMKEGLTVRFGLDQREPFYEVFAQTMHDLGTPVLPRAFFERVAAGFPELVVFGVVYRGEQPLAAGCGFVWRDEFELTWAGDLRASRRISANMLLYWSFMEQMIGRGVRTFNFGRCSPGGGTHHFKLQWGGSDVSLLWHHYARNGRKGPPSPDDSAFSWGPRVWRRLPMFVTNRLGPRIVRYLP